MNDIVNLMCVAIIAFIIFYLIFKDYKVCENFENEELVCNYTIDNRIMEFFEESKENKYNEVKLNKILEYPADKENKETIKFIQNKDEKNIYEVLTGSGYVTTVTVQEDGKDVVKYKVKDNNIEINLEYIIKLLQKYKKEKDDNIIIKVVKNSKVFDEGIIDIGKVLVSSN